MTSYFSQICQYESLIFNRVMADVQKSFGVFLKGDETALSVNTLYLLEAIEAIPIEVKIIVSFYSLYRRIYCPSGNPFLDICCPCTIGSFCSSEIYANQFYFSLHPISFFDDLGLGKLVNFLLLHLGPLQLFIKNSGQG